MNNRDTIAIRICLALLVALCAYVVWATQLDGVITEPPVTYWQGSFGTTKDVYHRGEPLKVRVIVDKFRDLPGDISWSIMNVETEELFRFANRSSTFSAGYYDHIVEIATIPQYVPAGRYKALGYTTFEINGLKSITYHMETNEFRVVNGD